MRRVVFYLEICILVIFATVFFCPYYAENTVTNIPATIDKMQENRVVVNCPKGSGQGIVAHNGPQGAWILTAKHILADETNCNCLFKDTKYYPAVSQWKSKKSDLALLQTNAEWKTSAHIVPVTLGSTVYAFGELVESHGKFDFNDTLYEGKVLYKVPFFLIKKEHEVNNVLHSRPGSSGGGVFNVDGDVEGLITRWSPNSNESGMIDVYSTLKDEGIKI